MTRAEGALPAWRRDATDKLMGGLIQLCEYEDCDQLATGYVKAWWTIADFVRYEGCDEHLWNMREQLYQWRVEGYTPEMSIGWYD